MSLTWAKFCSMVSVKMVEVVVVEMSEEIGCQAAECSVISYSI